MEEIQGKKKKIVGFGRNVSCISLPFQLFIYICVCLCICVYIYLYTHTHTVYGNESEGSILASYTGSTHFTLLMLRAGRQKHTHAKRPTCSHSHQKEKNRHYCVRVWVRTFPWLGNQLLQCVSVITPDSPGDECNTLWRCKMCFGNVSGIALWHC